MNALAGGLLSERRIGLLSERRAQAADDGGISAGLEHLKFALEDIAQCYKNESATYRLDITSSVTLRDGERVRRIRIPSDWNHAVGIILAMPGRPARTVVGSVGPSTLIQLGPSAAAEYFGESGCRRDQ